MDATKRTYETTVILNASLDDAQADAVIARIQETITKHGGNITSIEKWGRKRLAYPISKKTNGYYVHIEFEADGALIAHLDRVYQLDEMVLRFLTILLDRKAMAARAAALAAKPAEPEVTPEAPKREPLFDEPDAKTEKE